jgi:hypothetical protein
MVMGGAIERRAVRELALGQVPPRPADEVVRLAHRSCHDPLARRCPGCLRRDPRHHILMVDRVREVDERLGEHPEMHQVRVGVHQIGQDRRPFDVDEPRAGPRRGTDIVEGTEYCHATIADGERLRAGPGSIARHHAPAVSHDGLHARDYL